MTRRPNKPERPSRLTKAKNEPNGDELPMLEPIDDGMEALPSLEPLESLESEPVFPVKVACASSDEAGFDTAIAIEVPDLDKKLMVEAVAAPLQYSLANGKANVRHHRVLVRFAGDAIIGSAVKERCGQILDVAKARKVVVRRGYGDEVLFERDAPRATVAVRRDGLTTSVEVDTGELESDDLSMALQGDLVQLTKEVKGQKVQFTFRGGAKPGQDLRNLIAQMTRDAGALRAALGQRVLFDRELEDRVKLEAKGDVATVHVTPSAVDAETEESLAMKLSALGDQLRGKVVRVSFALAPSEGVRSSTLRYCTAGAPQRVEILRGSGVEVVWPSLLTVEDRGAETVLQVVQNGRDRAAMLAVFTAECRDYAPVIANKKVLVAWPLGMVVDEAIESACLQPLVAQGATAVASLVAGEREVFHPAAVSASADGATQVVCVNTESGKPAELQRAFERWLRRHGPSLHNATARLSFQGEVPPSRSLVRALVEQLTKAQPSRLELADGSRRDVVLPLLLNVAGDAQSGWCLRMEPAGRDDAQVQQAIVRELANLTDLGGAAVTVLPSALQDALIHELVKLAVGSVVVGGANPVQVYPGLLMPLRQKGGLGLLAQPTGDAALSVRMIERELPLIEKRDGPIAGQIVEVAWAGAGAATEPFATLLRALIARGAKQVFLRDGQDHSSGRRTQVHPEIVPEFVTVLGRKDDAVPPLLMLGIGLDDAAGHEERLLQALEGRSELLVGRRVLLVGRREGVDVPFVGDGKLVLSVRDRIAAAAAATLVFAGKDRSGRSYFTVAQSTIAGLAVGASFADPRPR